MKGCLICKTLGTICMNCLKNGKRKQCAVVHCKNTQNLIPNSDKTSYICEDCLTPNENTTTWELRF